ncbi:MAG: RecX family transcriptional regulator [Candidatus Izemoplasmatales bacterium]
MFKVQELKKQKNKTYTVTFLIGDNTQSFDVSEDLVVEYRLIKDKELTDEMYQSFLLSESIDVYFQSTLKYVLKYQKSVKETYEYLLKKGISEDLIGHVLQKLKKYKVLDDERLIEYLFDYQANQMLSGPEKIRFLFTQKGFSELLIANQLSGYTNQKIERNLTSLFNKRISHYKNNSTRQAKNKMMTYLVSKGYELKQVQAFVIHHQDDISALIDESKELKREYTKVLDKSRKLGLSNDALKQKVIQKLLSKGFQYQDIIKILERSNS